MNENPNRSAARVVPFLFVLACIIGSIAGVEALPIDLSTPRSFAPGDVLISLRTGEVQWWSRDGALVGVLVNAVPGKAEGMGFDTALNLYVTHHCADNFCLGGNAVERFSTTGVIQIAEKPRPLM